METNLRHWRYFLAIEEDLPRISRYVEFAKENFKTHSLEVSRLLMTATQEIDVLLKLICIENGADADNIGDYMKSIPSVFPLMSDTVVLLPRYGLKFAPFKEWESNQVPSWWTANNKIKHQRSSKFAQGNVENMLFAVCGLFVANLYFYHMSSQLGDLDESAKFLVAEGIDSGKSLSNFGVRTRYEIP